MATTPHAFVLENDTALARLVCHLLTEEGYTPSVVTDHESLLAALHAHPAPAIALIHQDPAYHMRAVAILEAIETAGPVLRRHGYVIYGTVYSFFTPDQRQLLFRTAAWFVDMPFDFIQIVDAVNGAASRLSP